MSEIFQERHTTGYLWWKITYYKYFHYINGSMTQISIISSQTLKDFEGGK